MIRAIGNGLGLAMVQFVYVARRVIPPIYSIDAFFELLWTGGFSGSGSLDGKLKSLTAVISTIEVVDAANAG